MNTRLLIQMLIALFVLAGCQHEPPEAPPADTSGGGGGTGGGGGGGGGTPVICDPDTVYFQQAVLPLIVSSCAIPGCHDPGSNEDGVTLNNYQNIFNTGDIDPFDLDGSDLYEVITDTDPDKRMPPPGEYPPLSSDEIAIIRNWILQGALNNSCESAEYDTTNVTYALSIEPIMESKCMGCHSGSSPQGGLSLSNYAEISSEALFGDVLASVQHANGVTAMPYNSAQLPQCEIDLIRIWIENGALE
ncbi:MAG: c-type cytochrome domain-containing protein [Cryomorphaceae bacterium]